MTTALSPVAAPVPSVEASPPRVLVLGGGGYAGWPVALRLSMHGFAVIIADTAHDSRPASLVPVLELPDRVAAWNRLAKSGEFASSGSLGLWDLDLCDGEAVRQLLLRAAPDSVVHLATGAKCGHSARVLATLLTAARALPLRMHVLVVKFAGESLLDQQLVSAVASDPGPADDKSLLRVSELRVGGLWGLQTKETLLDPALRNSYAPSTPQDLAVHALLQLQQRPALATFSQLRFEAMHLEDFVEAVRAALCEARGAGSVVAYAAWRLEGQRLNEIMATDPRVDAARSDLAGAPRSVEGVSRSVAEVQATAQALSPHQGGAAEYNLPAREERLAVALHSCNPDSWTQRVAATWSTAHSRRISGGGVLDLQLYATDGDASELRRALGASAVRDAASAEKADVVHVLLSRRGPVPWAIVLRALWAGTPIMVTPLDKLTFGSGQWLCSLLMTELPLEEHARSSASLAWRASPSPDDYRTTREAAQAARRRLSSWRALTEDMVGRQFAALLCGEAESATLAAMARSAVLRHGSLVVSESDHHGEACYAGRGICMNIICFREPTANRTSPTLLRGVDIVIYLGGPLEGPAAAIRMGVPVLWRLADDVWGAPPWAFDASLVRFVPEAFSTEEFDAALFDVVAMRRGGETGWARRTVPTPAQGQAEIVKAYRKALRERRMCRMLISRQLLCFGAVLAVVAAALVA